MPIPDPTVVGLSPAFWAHVPLTIRHVQELRLLNGFNCLIRKDPATDKATVLPLSKCELVGVIVAVESRGSTGGVIYVIDDGTGVIDCLHWPDDDGLPSLTSLEPESNILPVGTYARVFGRIECVAIGPKKDESIGYDDRMDCIREIHASIVQDAIEIDGPPKLGEDDLETQHWKRSVKILSSPDMLLTSDDIIRLLGPEIAKQIEERATLPAADTSDGAWRVFGSQCLCELEYKYDLLYCHCQATRESLDPDFVYRDALLKELINLEQRQRDGEPLRFQFRTITNTPHLDDIAKSITNSTASQQSLILGTFRSLRKDGILFLLDPNSDTYMLISKERALESYIEIIASNDIERGLERAALRRDPPAFLQHVPKPRIQFVKRNFKQNK